MGLDFLEALQVFSELSVESVRDELVESTLAHISLSVQEPLGDVVIYAQS